MGKDELEKQEHRMLKDLEQQMRGAQWSMSHYYGLRTRWGCISDGDKKKNTTRGRGPELRA